MTLREMGQDYLFLSQRLIEKMHALKQTRDRVPAQELSGLDARIALLYTEALEARRTGRRLMGYYAKGAGDASQALYT